jgi:GDP/UDP-N,N'-diacetylbacillosamine 2-epimerase (hydrolysing)
VDAVGGVTKMRVLAITGIRSEYFFQRPILRAIQGHPDLDLQLVVTGAHLSRRFGYTVSDVRADGFPIVEEINNLIDSDEDSGRLHGAALQLQHLSQTLDRHRPDWLLVSGDREETITAAVAGTYLNVAIAHYSAGDRVVGNADDTIRHAVSRLAHLLLTTSEDSRQRLIRSGEEEWRVHNVGHSGIDRLASTPEMSTPELAAALGMDGIPSPFAVVIQHPLSSQRELAGPDMRATLEAVGKSGLHAFVSYPNSDPGSRVIIEVIEEARQRGGLTVFRNIPDPAFVNLLRRAALLIGNSSMGLLEAPFLKLPVINVGARQSERIHAENVFFVEASVPSITDRIEAILHDAPTRERIRNCSNPFGSGRTGTRVAELLAVTAIDDRLRNKRITY